MTLRYQKSISMTIRVPVAGWGLSCRESSCKAATIYANVNIQAKLFLRFFDAVLSLWPSTTYTKPHFVPILPSIDLKPFANWVIILYMDSGQAKTKITGIKYNTIRNLKEGEYTVYFLKPSHYIRYVNSIVLSNKKVFVIFGNQQYVGLTKHIKLWDSTFIIPPILFNTKDHLYYYYRKRRFIHARIKYTRSFANFKKDDLWWTSPDTPTLLFGRLATKTSGLMLMDLMPEILKTLNVYFQIPDVGELQYRMLVNIDTTEARDLYHNDHRVRNIIHRTVDQSWYLEFLDKGEHHIRHSKSDITFLVYVGHQRYSPIEYELTATYIRDGISSDCHKKPAKPGDQIDNDCDLQIDEEKFNSCDDDFDFLVDEDTYAIRSRGFWGQWGMWQCPVKCQSTTVAKMVRYRTCNSPPAKYSGPWCIGNGTEEHFNETCKGDDVVCFQPKPKNDTCPDGLWGKDCLQTCPRACPMDCHLSSGKCIFVFEFEEFWYVGLFYMLVASAILGGLSYARHKNLKAEKNKIFSHKVFQDKVFDLHTD